MAPTGDFSWLPHLGAGMLLASRKQRPWAAEEYPTLHKVGSELRIIWLKMSIVPIKELDLCYLD